MSGEAVSETGKSALMSHDASSGRADAVPETTAATKDHFIVVDGERCAGKHLIVDLWGALHLDEVERMEAAMRTCVTVCGATLLHLHVHHFMPSGGVSGVAILAESHISVHTWPEFSYAAFDIFMCGDAKPELAVEVLQNAFSAASVEVKCLLRGQKGAALPTSLRVGGDQRTVQAQAIRASS